jgi:hypothetical protein
VQRHERVVGEALEEFVRQVDVERADHRTRERHVEFEPGASRKIEDDARRDSGEPRSGPGASFESRGGRARNPR